MIIELDGGGRFDFELPQQRWAAGPNGEHKDVLEVARFAGQELVVTVDDGGAGQLHYLGFTTGGFKSLESAKQAAPEFARRVLARMSAMIAD